MKLRNVLFALLLVLCLSTSAALAASNFTVNGVGYDTLQDAFANAASGGVITINRNVTGGGLVINKSIFIDFGGYTYTFTDPAVGSANTETNCFQILKKDNSGDFNNVILVNGTLKVADAARKSYWIMIQNYANLILTDMTLDGSNLDHFKNETDKPSYTNYSYTLSNNSGAVTLQGETNVIANDLEHSFAFDVCKFSSYEPPVVTVDTMGKISGEVEISSSLQNTDHLKIMSGAYEEFDPSKYVTGNTAVAQIDGENYYVGSEVIINAVKDGSKVTVMKGNLSATLDMNVVVENKGAGTVKVNGKTISKGGMQVFTKVTSLPKTGDESHFMLWVSLMAMSVCAFVVMARKTRIN